MSKIIAIYNVKGGVAKTITTHNLAVGLVKKGKKVLAIDLDAGALTFAMYSIEPYNIETTIANLMQATQRNEQIEKNTGIVTTDEGVDLIPSNCLLYEYDQELNYQLCRELVLRKYLENIKDDYDYILLDCMGTINTVINNALTAADSVLIPMSPEALTSVGANLLLRTIHKIKMGPNPDITIEGVLVTNLDARANLPKEIVDTIRNSFTNYNVYDVCIPHNISVSEAVSYTTSVLNYKPKSKGAIAYKTLVDIVASEEV